MQNITDRNNIHWIEKQIRSDRNEKGYRYYNGTNFRTFEYRS